MDRITVIEAVARNLGDLVVDTVPASLCGSYVDVTELIHPITGQLRGYHFYIYDGSGAGQKRTVGSFDPTYNRLGFPQAFTTVPSTNSDFIVTKHWDKDAYDNALDRTLGYAKQQYLEEKVATMLIVATQYEYAIPSVAEGFEYINTLRFVPSGSSDYDSDDEVSRIFEFAPRFWRIELNPAGSYAITFDPRKINIDSWGGEFLRVMGQVKPTVSATDNATVPVDLEEYLIAGTSQLLAAQKINEDREWLEKFRTFRDMRNELERYIYRPRRGKRVG